MGVPNHFNEHCYPKMMRVLRVHLAVHHQIYNFFLARLFLQFLSYFFITFMCLNFVQYNIFQRKMSFPLFLDNLDFLEMPQFCSLFYRAICCTCWLLLLGLENFTQLHVLLHFLFPRPAHLHSCDENECEHFYFHPSRVKEVGRIFVFGR